eukprot:6885601-Alexandrium_andersonii.AAC.1
MGIPQRCREVAVDVVHFQLERHDSEAAIAQGGSDLYAIGACVLEREDRWNVRLVHRLGNGHSRARLQ